MAGIPFSKYYSLLREYLSPLKSKVAMLSFLILSNISLQLINPQIIRFYIDSVSNDVGLRELQMAALLYILIASVQFFIMITSVYYSQDIAWTSTNALRSNLVRHCVGLDMTFHNQYKAGQMIERVDGDVNALSNFFSRLALVVFSNILLIIGVLFALYLESFLLGFAFTIFVFGSIFLTYFVRNIAVPYWKRFREANMELFGYIEERIGGTEDIRAIGATEGVMKGFHAQESNRYNAVMKAIIVSRLVSIVFIGLVAISSTMVYALGVPLYQSGEISIGTLFLISYYVAILIQPVFEILRQIQNLQEADASIERIEELFTLTSKIENNGSKRINGEGFNLSFNNVNFEYHENTPILKNIELEMAQGEKIGLIGRTGSGKTTMSRLIFRLYDVNSGSITINEENIQEFELEHLRQKIALVTQDVQLFRTTIRNNVSFFNKNIPDDQIIKILHDVGLGKWLEGQEDGLNTEMSSNEHGLSAGEAQLLALTRIFIKDPQMVILDEASSRLDPVTEHALDVAIERLVKDKTALIIAHRLETLEKVDKIVILDDGEIIERGPRLKLANDPESKYAQLLKSGIEEVLS